MAVFFLKRGASSSLGKRLSDYVEGDIVLIPENGTNVEFYVAKHDYESSLNGSGRTLVVRKDGYDLRSWHSDGVNAWASCTTLSWLNSNYKALLDSDIQSLIGTTTYYYTPGFDSWGVTTRSDAVFLLSFTELGESNYYANVEGSALPIASTLKIAYQNGSATIQWTRSPYKDNRYSAWVLLYNGTIGSSLCTYTHSSRPCFTLPSNTLFDPDTNIIKG